MKIRQDSGQAKLSDVEELSKLKESTNLFRNTFEQAAAGLAPVGMNGIFLRINPKFCDVIKNSKEELLTRKFQDITHPDDLAADLNNIQQLLDQKTNNYSMENLCMCKGSSIVWVDFSVSQVLEGNGEPMYFIAVA